MSNTAKFEVPDSGDNGKAYVYTQLEALYARRVFPCFDEPGVKIPWQLTLRVKPSDAALSNTPVVEEKTDADGFKTVRFAPTKPLPMRAGAMCACTCPHALARRPCRWCAGWT